MKAKLTTCIKNFSNFATDMSVVVSFQIKAMIDGCVIEGEIDQHENLLQGTSRDDQHHSSFDGLSVARKWMGLALA